jgi:hypothetical protein
MASMPSTAYISDGVYARIKLRKDDRKNGDNNIGSGMYTGVDEKLSPIRPKISELLIS